MLDVSIPLMGNLSRARNFFLHSLLIAVIVLLTACGGTSETTFDDQGVNRTAFDWQLPASVPLPFEPENNPMTEAKFQLGRHLFFDRRLSGNGEQSCADCHQQNIGFTDGLVVSVGSTGDLHPRNAQPLLNVAYNATLTWANPSLVTLEQQILVPLFGEFPVEQGINDGNREEVLDRLRDEPRYQTLFAEAYPELGDPIDYENIVKAIASFVRGMVSFNSDFDRYERGQSSALSASAQQGRKLFFGEELECFHCHGGYNLSDSTFDRTMTFIERPFHNTGLFNINGTGDFPSNNQGVFEITEDPADMGKFRAPSLRNIALTAPYMHDGSLVSLEEVIDFYAAGGRNIESGPHAGDGRLNPFKDGFVTGFDITEQEKADLIAFLNSLTDETFLTNERFSDPWSTL
ncbi:methanobactin export MATE transporter MbnM [Hahella ganghwensis]|uniref:methanobactin export MATE transporter MbnM n=1 Tax=Hahella ganghwensis TaxID=286420 RepID=UPI000367FF25|nr:methanobactin export MATE transporter MbnM [Hahella ganghwensis]